MSDLKTGFLRALRDKVAKDDTLMIALRNTSINLYYRGGSIIKLSRLSDGVYEPIFNTNYSEESQALVANLPSRITNTCECGKWVSALASLKECMNCFFVEHPKAEREFQQLVVWENNRSAVANETEYFITDIEFASEARNARIDMLGLKWRAGDRKSGSRCAPVLFEMKWGDKAYGGTAGIEKHIKDILGILGDEKQVANINAMIGRQFRQLYDLGIMRVNWSSAVKHVEPSHRPEIVFVLANHNPRSTKIREALEVFDHVEKAHATLFEKIDLRFFVASFAGYGMHEACMLNLDDFRKLVANFVKQ